LAKHKKNAKNKKKKSKKKQIKHYHQLANYYAVNLKRRIPQ